MCLGRDIDVIMIEENMTELVKVVWFEYVQTRPQEEPIRRVD